jgi:hypothetical protein
MKLSTRCVTGPLVLVALASCQIETGSKPTTVPIAPLGPETWTIGGRQYGIRSTYFLNESESLRFVVEYACSDRCPNFDDLSEQGALAVAYPVMAYTMSHRLYERTKVMNILGKPLETRTIGVVIVEEARSGRERGYRIERSLEQLRARPEEATGPDGRR